MKSLLCFLILLPTLSFAKNFVPTSFSANYEESLTSATGKVKKSYGKIDYKYPGHLRFEVTSPVESLLVINPQTSWLYQPAVIKGEKGQVTVQKSSNLPLIKFLDSVKDGLNNSKLFKAKTNKNDVTLTFNEKMQKDMGISEVVLHSKGEAKDVKELKGFDYMTLKYTNRNQTNIKLIDLKEGASFGADHFTFKPGPDVKVNKN